MATSLVFRGLVLILLASGTHALRITPDSACSAVCGDTTATDASDIVCNDYDYYGAEAGLTFKSCIECLQTSNATRDSDNDVSWYLYNLRYASAVCLFDFPTLNASASSISACNVDHACAPLQGAIISGDLNPGNETQYGYCQADDDAFYGTSINDCVSCLQSSPSTYTANFLLALEAGCKQEPAPGALLSITGTLFSTTALNITTPSNTPTTSSSTTSSSHQLSTSTIIAIAVTLGALFLAATALFTLYYLRQRRYAREDAHLTALHRYHDTNHPGEGYLYYGKSPSGGDSHSHISPKSHTTSASSYALQPAPPHYTVDYKSPSPEPFPPQQQQQDYDSNAEYYDRLEGRSRGRPLAAHPVRLTASQPSSSSPAPAADAALPTHPAYIPRTITPGALGGRASRSASVSGSNRSEQQQSRRSSGDTASKAVKKQPYAMEVYLDGRGDEPVASRAPSRNLELKLSERGSYESHSKKQARISPPPPVALHTRRRVSLSPPPPQAPDRAMTGTPAISALLLPPVPRLRMPGRRGTPAPEDAAATQVPLDKDLGISGPLAFPDRRFTVRPGTAMGMRDGDVGGGGGERIVEQTVERVRRAGVEMPIGSGKSYLYG